MQKLLLLASLLYQAFGKSATISCACDNFLTFHYSQDGVTFERVGSAKYTGWRTAHTVTLPNIEDISKVRIKASNDHYANDRTKKIHNPAGLNCKIVYDGDIWYTNANTKLFRIIAAQSGGTKIYKASLDGTSTYGNVIGGPSQFIWNSPARNVPVGWVLFEFEFPSFAEVSCAVDNKMTTRFSKYGNGQFVSVAGGSGAGWVEPIKFTIPKVFDSSQIEITATNLGRSVNPAGLNCIVDYQGYLYMTTSTSPYFTIKSATAGGLKKYKGGYTKWGQAVEGEFIWNNGAVNVPPGNVVFNFKFETQAIIDCIVDDYLEYYFSKDGLDGKFRRVPQTSGPGRGWRQVTRLILNDVTPRSLLRVKAVNDPRYGGAAGLKCRITYGGVKYYTSKDSDRWSIIDADKNGDMMYTSGNNKLWPGQGITDGGAFIWNDPKRVQQSYAVWFQFDFDDFKTPTKLPAPEPPIHKINLGNANIVCAVDNGMKYYYAENGKDFEQIGKDNYAGWTTKHSITINNVQRRSVFRVKARNYGFRFAPNRKNPAGLNCAVTIGGKTYYTRHDTKYWKIVAASTGGKKIYKGGYTRWGNVIGGNSEFIWNNGAWDVPVGTVTFDFSFKKTHPKSNIECAVDNSLIYQLSTNNGASFSNIGSGAGWTKPIKKTILVNNADTTKLRIIAHNAANHPNPAGLNCKINYNGYKYLTSPYSPYFKIVSSTSGTSKKIYHSPYPNYGQSVEGSMIWNSPSMNVPPGNVVFQFSYTTTALVQCVIDNTMVWYYAKDGKNFVNKGRRSGWTTIHSMTLTGVNPASKLRIIAQNWPINTPSKKNPAGLKCKITVGRKVFYTHTKSKYWRIIKAEIGGKQMVQSGYTGRWVERIRGGMFLWNNGAINVPAKKVTFEFSFDLDFRKGKTGTMIGAHEEQLNMDNNNENNEDEENEHAIYAKTNSMNNEIYNNNNNNNIIGQFTFTRTNIIVSIASALFGAFIMCSLCAFIILCYKFDVCNKKASKYSKVTPIATSSDEYTTE